MPTSTRFRSSVRVSQIAVGPPSRPETDLDPQLARWGGIAGLAGAALMVSAAAVVGVLGLPDASDVETLTDFTNIESGRIAEHFLYLGALIGFSLHLAVLHRLLQPTHPAGALFGLVTAGFGLVIMAASSLLHVSTSPLADLYTDPATADSDLPAIEYAWYGAQSIFDTMLTTGVLLVPIGMVFLGIAMRRSPGFGRRLATVSIALGTIGIIGAVVAVVDPGSLASAASVLAIAVFHLTTGWRTVKLADPSSIDLTDVDRDSRATSAEPA